MKHIEEHLNLEIRRFYIGLAVASDLWWLDVPTKLPSGTYRAYQLIGTQLKRYDEMFVFSAYLLFFKFTLAWFRK